MKQKGRMRKEKRKKPESKRYKRAKKGAKRGWKEFVLERRKIFFREGEGGFSF
jgi:hypothetical protein